MTTAEAIIQVCDEMKAFLLAKNKAYGDSAAKPVRVFSDASTIDGINMRLDDKLSRMIRGSEFQGDDTELDFTGYLLLKMAIQLMEKDAQNENN